MLGDGFGGLNQPKKPEPVNIVLTVTCSIKEFFNGAIKHISYERQVKQADGSTTKP